MHRGSRPARPRPPTRAPRGTGCRCPALWCQTAPPLPRSANTGSGAVAQRFFSEACDMARRKRLDNPPGADFLCHLPAGPWAERATSATGGCAGQRHDVAPLFGGDPGRLARTGRIRQALGNAPVLHTDRVAAAPTRAPETDGVDVHPHTARHLGIGVSCGSGQEKPCPDGELLGGRMPPDHSVQRVPCVGSQRHEWWWGPTQSDRPAKMCSMRRVQDIAGPLYHRKIRAQGY